MNALRRIHLIKEAERFRDWFQRHDDEKNAEKWEKVAEKWRVSK